MFIKILCFGKSMNLFLIIDFLCLVCLSDLNSWQIFLSFYFILILLSFFLGLGSKQLEGGNIGGEYRDHMGKLPLLG